MLPPVLGVTFACEKSMLAPKRMLPLVLRGPSELLPVAGMMSAPTLMSPVASITTLPVPSAASIVVSDTDPGEPAWVVMIPPVLTMLVSMLPATIVISAGSSSQVAARAVLGAGIDDGAVADIEPVAGPRSRRSRHCRPRRRRAR